MSAINQDAPIEENDPAELNEDRAAEELLRRFADPDPDASKKKPSKTEKAAEEESAKSDDEPADDKSAAEKPEDEAEGKEDDETKETDDKANDEDGEKKFADEEGTFVKIKVGDEEHEVPVNKLTRLYGQEAALTKKSMEVAEQRKVAEADTAKNTAATAALLERAKSRFEPYAKLDFNLLATQLQPDEYTALRNAAQAAWEDVQFLEKNLNGFMDGLKTKQSEDLREKAKEAIKVLAGPADKGGIEGWSQKVYDDIRAFAVAQGAPAEVINSVTDPWAIRLMHDAMLYARSRSKSAPVKTIKVNKSPKKIVKTTTSPAGSRDDAKPNTSTHMARLKRTGSTDDAAELFLASWKKQDAD